MNRPACITVFGVLNIVFAAFGVIASIASIGLFLAPGNSNNPVIKIMQENTIYADWLKLCIPLGLLSCGVLLVAGIGLLCLKPWARVLSVGYAIYAILFGILSTAINFIFLIQPMLKSANGQQTPAAIGGMIGGSIGGCFGLIYPIALLVFMLRPNVVAAFHPAQTDGK
jgi:hypothetical protein